MGRLYVISEELDLLSSDNMQKDALYAFRKNIDAVDALLRKTAQTEERIWPIWKS